MKKGRLNKVEKFYIEQNLWDLSVEEMATDLDRSLKTVANYVQSLGKEETPKEDTKFMTTDAKKAVTTTKREGPIDKLIGKKRGATIYTQEAAEHADATRSERINQDTRYTVDCIHRPKG